MKSRYKGFNQTATSDFVFIFLVFSLYSLSLVVFSFSDWWGKSFHCEKTDSSTIARNKITKWNVALN